LEAPPAPADLARIDLVLDAVFGLGARPGLPPELAELAQACRELRLPLVSADLPSGLAADACAADQPASFWATRTVAFGAWKPCHVLQPARDRCGARSLVEIGLVSSQADLLEVELSDLAAWWPWPQPTSDKYSRGVVGFDTGSERYPGAAVLGVLGAVWAGAGLVRYVGPVGPAVLAAAPNVICQALDSPAPAWPGLVPTEQARHQSGLAQLRVQAWVIGSGWGERSGLAARLSEAVASGRPVVVDADGLRVGLAGLPGAAGLEPDQVVGPLNPSVLLTPHAGELAACLGWERRQVEADPVTAVRRLSDLTGATVLLKGSTQYVARPGQATVHLAFPGPAWTAQAGSGDVLAGICGALLAAGLPAWQAGLAGASIQALAAVRHLGPYPPQALVRRLPAVIASLGEFGPAGPSLVGSGPEAEDGLWL
jgi:hydroxyethylthiazole kinase-like uncharacterized protein yjeF